MDAHIRELIEACRPDRADLSLPEMQELSARLESDAEVREAWEATKRWDSAVAEAFHDVPVPAGLCERLLADVESRSLPTVASSAEEADANPESAVERHAEARTSRRRWFIAATSLAAAACVALMIGQFYRTRPVSVAELETAVDHWTLQAVTWDAEDWQTWREPLDAHPFSSAIRVRPRGWHPLATDFDGEAVVYDLAARGSGQAFLFVADTSRRFDLPTAPHHPLKLGGGWQSGSWKEGRTLYVLAVRNAKLDEFVRTPAIARTVPRHAWQVASID
ncbi:MAG: hypothetical protein KDA62_17480 [Planctomycetales bacterium]|nr:hypothetical protein [Planctomycetales bacterium]